MKASSSRRAVATAVVTAALLGAAVSVAPSASASVGQGYMYGGGLTWDDRSLVEDGSAGPKTMGTADQWLGPG